MLETGFDTSEGPLQALPHNKSALERERGEMQLSLAGETGTGFLEDVLFGPGFE